MSLRTFLNTNHRAVSVIVIIFSLAYALIMFWSSAVTYTKRYDPNYYEKRYIASQWRVPNSENPISDSELYLYSGYRYLQGDNPILINPEQPPLGKYIIGLSIVLFGNGYIASLVFALLLLYIVYRMVFHQSGSILASSLSVLLVSTNSLFTDQIVNPGQLDIFQLVFFLLFGHFYLEYLIHKHNKHLYSAGILLGAFLSIKVFVHSFLIMFLLIGLMTIFNSDKKSALIDGIRLLIIGLCVFVLTYGAYFMHGGTLRGLLGVQRWIVDFYSKSTIDMYKIFGSYIPLVFFNKWRVWSEGYPYVSYERWSVLWPLTSITGIVAIYRIITDKLISAHFFRLYVFFILLYMVNLAIVPVFPRYLLMLFVPMIIITVTYVQKKYRF